MRRIIPFIALFSYFPVTLVAQEVVEEKKEVKEEKPKEAKPEKVKAEKAPYKFNPSLGAGVGVTRFFGDVEDVNSTNIHRLGNRLAYDFSFKTNLSNSFNLSVNVLFGKLSGNENEHRENRNFESKLFSAGLNLEYNFKGFYKKKTPFLTPFASVGIYYADYNPRADLYDGDGNQYFYWEDGFIRNLPENTSNPDDVEYLERDFNYETHLTEFPVVSVAVPVAGGFDFHLGQKITFRVSSSYFFSFSDKVDNYDDAKYSKKKDGYYYNSVSVFFNFLYDKKEKKEKLYQFYDFTGVDGEDSDQDGIADIDDMCAKTPKKVKVDEFGCPLDTDKDGIVDYLDKEPATPLGNKVDGDGVTLNFTTIEKSNSDSVSMKHDQVNDRNILAVRTKPRYTVHVATTGKEIPKMLVQTLNSLEGIIENKINDSLTIFTIGNYEDFADAQDKQNQLLGQGLNDAFGVSVNEVERVSGELNQINTANKGKGNQSKTVNLPPSKDEVVFKVQINEYRLRLQLDKLANIMAKEGVELRTTTGGMKLYNIGSYDTYEKAVAMSKELVQYGVKETKIIALINNKTVSVEEAQKFIKDHKKK